MSACPKIEIFYELWERAELSWKLDSLQKKIRAQLRLVNSDKACILSARQIGKSFLISTYATEECLRNDNIIVRILSPTLKQTADIVNDNLSRIILDAPFGFIERQKSEYRWRIGNSTLRLGSLERSNVDGNRGGNATLCIFEEGGFVSSEDYRYAVESVIGPQLLRSGGREIHISSPSEDEFHYLHEVIAPQCSASQSLFRYTIYDSPSLDSVQIQKAIDRCGGSHTEAFRREYLAEIIRSGQLMVVPEFDEKQYVREFALPEYYKAIVQWDLGGTVDKTAQLAVVWDFDNQRMLVWDENLFEPNTATSEIVRGNRLLIEQINWRSDKPFISADCPGQIQIDLIKEYQCNVVVPAKDDRDAQIAAIRRMFQMGKILIHPRCKYLIGCLKTARYNKKRTDFERHKIYGHCDPLMALVYANRMLDKQTNPYPARTWNRDTQLYVPYRTPFDQGLEAVAKELVPYNPIKSAYRRR